MLLMITVGWWPTTEEPPGAARTASLIFLQEPWPDTHQVVWPEFTELPQVTDTRK